MKKIITLAACMFVGAANAGIITNNFISGSITNDFEGVATGSTTGLISQTGAQYGELFTGQVLGTSGVFDTLSGSPTAALNLEANANASDNVGVMAYGSSNIIFGDLNSAVGEGALSILLDNETNVFGFEIAGSNAGDFLVEFYSSTGGSLGSFSQTASNSFFGFEVNSGSLIRAISITNTDLAGIGYDNFTFNSMVASVPEPTSIALFALGLAGLGMSRKKKNV